MLRIALSQSCPECLSPDGLATADEREAIPRKFGGERREGNEGHSSSLISGTDGIQWRALTEALLAYLDARRGLN